MYMRITGLQINQLLMLLLRRTYGRLGSPVTMASATSPVQCQLSQNDNRDNYDINKFINECRESLTFYNLLCC